MDKTIITYKNSQPGNYLLDIENTEQLSLTIIRALTPSLSLKDAIKNYSNDLHPYKDGRSSQRIMDAVEMILTNGKSAKKRKPFNIFRSFKIRKKLNYWKF